MATILAQTRRPGFDAFATYDTMECVELMEERWRWWCDEVPPDMDLRVMLDGALWRHRSPAMSPGGLIQHPLEDDSGECVGFMPMRHVPPGTFIRGDDTSRWPDERPRMAVEITHGYFLAEHPTTVGEFSAFVSATGHITTAEREKDSRTWRDPKFPRKQDDTHPVVCVSHNDAVAFAAWAGLSLPTEAQWEYAARGTDGRTYPWGNDVPTGRDDPRLHWMADMTCPVGTHPSGASLFGIHDMAGNVWEWTADWFANYGPAVTTDPTGPKTGTSRVLRGGSWVIIDSDYVRAANRKWNSPLFHWFISGFRCARGV